MPTSDGFALCKIVCKDESRGGKDGGSDIEVESLIAYSDSPVVNAAKGWNGVCGVADSNGRTKVLYAQSPL